ncbi:MAG TPA: acyl-CoA dehydrogenase family protein [Candidatus Acidoferrales bacterium]|nr:acyl-CoA dehydrogenase family protein [Candidatus Acidoferrales bacterium]
MSILTAEQKQLQQTTREFVAKNIIPFAAKYDKTGEFHPYLLDAARESKIFAMAVPKEYGGLDYDALTQAVVLEEWGYGCAGMGTTLAASILSMDSVLAAGNEEQKKRYFEPMVRGEIGSFGLTEPGAGSDAGAGKMTAVKVGDEYVLNGTKCWITNGGFASVYVIYASTDPSKGVKGLSAFIVEKGRPGFTIGTVDHKLGIRSSNTVELLFKDVRIPASNLLGKEGEGMKIAMMTLDMARPAIASLSVGICQRALDECVKHLQQKFPGKEQPGQTLQFKLADMRTETDAARELLHYTMKMRDAGIRYSVESAECKVYAADMAMKITSQAVSLMGSYGYTSEIAKLMRDAKIMQIYEGTNQIQRLVISRAVLAPAPAAAQKAGK